MLFRSWGVSQVFHTDRNRDNRFFGKGYFRDEREEQGEFPPGVPGDCQMSGSWARVMTQVNIPGFRSRQVIVSEGEAGFRETVVSATGPRDPV